jgi:hypothetical protein
MEDKVIGWWSGGITSAVTCKMITDLYGVENCRFIFIDTKNEDESTYQFKIDCEKWYGKEIETITRLGDEYESIEDVWFKFKSLNVANGAICSSELKRDLRKKWQKDNEYRHQAFGFDIDELKRAKSMSMNYPNSKPIFPLLLKALSKKDCLKIVEEAGIEIPAPYKHGFLNNNCFKTMCIQGGIGYWQMVRRVFPDKFDRMADIEHKLTDLKEKPVTMLKDQSNAAKESGSQLLFLKPHPNYPDIKDISMMKGREPKPLMECNGFCGVNDLEDKKNIETASELNWDDGENNLFTIPRLD